MNRNPGTFDALSMEASRDNGKILIEIETIGHMAFVFRADPQSMLNLARQLERAFHQESKPDLSASVCRYP